MEKRLYGLYEKQDGKWVRLYDALAFKKSVAVRVFQDALLAPYMAVGREIRGIRELRPIK